MFFDTLLKKGDETTSPVVKLIDEFSGWQAQKYPYISGGERSLLVRFCRNFNIQEFDDITPDKIAYFVGEELSEAYSQRAQISFRKFMRYARWAGYNAPRNDRELAEFMEPARPGRPPKTDYALEVQALIRKGKSIRQIKALLEEKYKQPFHIMSIHRWSKMLVESKG